MGEKSLLLHMKVHQKKKLQPDPWRWILQAGGSGPPDHGQQTKAVAKTCPEAPSMLMYYVSPSHAKSCAIHQTATQEEHTYRERGP